MTINPAASLAEIVSLLDSIPAPAILMDTDYRICAANDAYRRQFPHEGELIGRRCYEISHGYSSPCDQAGETCPLRQCQQSGKRQRLLHIHNTPQGREHVNVELNPVRDEHGNIRYFVEIMQSAERTDTHQGRVLKGTSPAFTRMLELLSRAAPSDISVLLLGESGTGKELAAQYLHSHSQRANNPFVVVECTGLTESLFESELFGHEKGAFTGATQRKPGLVDAASGGTLFLDEIGDIPLAMQVKLLRLIESGNYRPVGSVTARRADFRLICATHRPLADMVEFGQFRRDLYYRISAFPVHLPNLAQRREDIVLLAQHLLSQLPASHARDFSEAACQWLQQQEFPGNIRQLRNHIERAILLCDHDLIEPWHLQPEIPSVSASTVSPLPRQSLQELARQPIPLDQLEQQYLQLLSQHPDKTLLAQQLGISERTLYRKLAALREQEIPVDEREKTIG
ncbi:sigma-54 interaction domain-containing protein [Parathalassolituus penaei]|uniref:Sigma 54-interacting transcriptional regulator n=1 Tax=Parathalassolituus penaei TaxID=2997323 RepID=A0A9X3EGP3_9GAMM|nr:sigma 54-interacting transcriptional regulator [Parathalassolituus penaei]MCY0967247.1 sigma 54-interacting transcriptional regulator [Parathalassolituus penaei]